MAAAETMPAYSRGSILGVLMHLAGAARTSAMGVAGIGVHLWWRLLAGCALPIWVAALTKVAAGAYIGITRVCPDVVAGLISSDGDEWLCPACPGWCAPSLCRWVANAGR